MQDGLVPTLFFNVNKGQTRAEIYASALQGPNMPLEGPRFLPVHALSL